MNASLGLNGSYSWRSIWGLKALLKEGLIWLVGDGSKINIFTDPWLTDELGRFVQTPICEEINLISDLVDQDLKEWNFNLISSLFNERDVSCIMAIPLV